MTHTHLTHLTYLTYLILSLLPAHAQDTNRVFPIDLPTALRLANAQNLDIQIARARVRQD